MPPRPSTSIRRRTTRACARPSPTCTASTRRASSAVPDRTRSSPSSPRPTPARAREVIHTEHGFGMYRISALAAGATPVEVQERDRHTDVDAILAACQRAHGARLHRQPEQPDRHDDPGVRDRTPRRRRCRARRFSSSTAPTRSSSTASTATPASSTPATTSVMTRTFSKIHGLGGLRVGWGYGPAHVIDVLNRVRGPFNLSTAALAAAEAAIRDTAWTERCRAENAAQPRRADRGAARPRHRLRHERGQLRPRALPRPGRGRGRRPGAPRPAASSSAASPATACRRRCASPSATPRPAPASPSTLGAFMKVRA